MGPCEEMWCVVLLVELTRWDPGPGPGAGPGPDAGPGPGPGPTELGGLAIVSVPWLTQQIQGVEIKINSNIYIIYI